MKQSNRVFPLLDHESLDPWEGGITGGMHLFCAMCKHTRGTDESFYLIHCFYPNKTTLHFFVWIWCSYSCLSSQRPRVASSDRLADRPHPRLKERVNVPGSSVCGNRTISCGITVGDLWSRSGATTRQVSHSNAGFKPVFDVFLC